MTSFNVYNMKKMSHTIKFILENRNKYEGWILCNKKLVKLNHVCKDCNYPLRYGNMVMVNDDLWDNICDSKEDIICDKCIEKRLNRTIQIKDLKPHKTNELNMIPCNLYWLEYNNKLNLIK